MSSPRSADAGKCVFAASIPALFLATAAKAENPPIRKANQDAIGVSRVTIPQKGEGNKGAGITPVKLDTSGWSGKETVVGPNGAAGGSSRGFFNGGETSASFSALQRWRVSKSI